MNLSLKPGDSMHSGTDVVEKPYSEIRDYVAQLERQTDRMNAIMQNLYSLLEPVLMPSPPTDGSKAGLSVAPSTKLGKELANILHANDATAAQLSELLDRIHC
jgi:hypothetical protein